MNLRIETGPVEDLSEYSHVPMRFLVTSRLDISALRRGEFVEIPVSPWLKDYDLLEPIATLDERFDTRFWGRLMAYRTENNVLVGGCIVVWKWGSEMLEDREDLAILWDIRVRSEFQSQGIGRQLFAAAMEWARERDCTELRVETQDVNVPALQFYTAMGCRLLSVQELAYVGMDEAKIIFTIPV